ncbi:putative WRKY transcription factor [Hibiscus syriacus]|uniref:WRKY transcription factor n=1 Tax=Hibiscus syriacus TaxID=106335 RepID=A0A6A2YPL4_HIBSY|nr:putative WRKY transcription factor [Hibiscus syriacus]
MFSTTTSQCSSSFTNGGFQGFFSKLKGSSNALKFFQDGTRWTNLCYLPPPSLRIICSNSQVTELTIVGKTSSSAGQTLSDKFSIDALFTVRTKLSNLKALYLGLWGPLPPKIGRFRSLQALNMTSNFVYREVPKQIAWLKNLTSLVLADNLFNGSVPDLTGLTLLQELNLVGNRLGPQLPSLSQSLVSITLCNNSFRSEIPSGLKRFNQLQKLDISSNRIVGPIPSFLFSLASIQYLTLAQNQLSGALPWTISSSKRLTFVDISNKLLIGKLPSCIGSNSKNKTFFSSWNCLSAGKLNRQHPYSVCNKQALAVKPVKRKEQHPGINFGLILVSLEALLSWQELLFC